MGLSQSFPGLTACQILVPWPWIEPGPPAVKAPSPNCWTPGSAMVQVSLKSSVPASCSSLSLASAFSADPITSFCFFRCALSCVTHHLLGFSTLPPSVLFLYFGCTVRFAGLVPQPRVEPAPPALAAQSLNHWITRAVPGLCCFWLLQIMLLWTSVSRVLCGQVYSVVSDVCLGVESLGPVVATLGL